MKNKEEQMAHNGLTQKKTAIEWLEEMINKMEAHEADLPALRIHIEQAKEMEKEQIIDAITIGFNEGRLYMDNGTTKFDTAIEYYNETFKNK